MALTPVGPHGLGRGLGALGGGVVAERDLRALGGERLADGAAEALPGAGDQHGGAGELQIHVVLLRR